MVNVLPQQYRQSVANAYTEHLIMTSAVALFLTGVVAGIALIPSFSIMYMARLDTGSSPSTEAQSSTLKADTAAVAQMQFLTKGLSSFATTKTRITELIAAIVADKPKNIHIQTITYTAGAADSQALVVTGKAAGRADITSFEDVLRADRHFTSISVPINALVNDTSSFTIHIVPAH